MERRWRGMFKVMSVLKTRGKSAYYVKKKMGKMYTAFVRGECVSWTKRKRKHKYPLRTSKLGYFVIH